MQKCVCKMLKKFYKVFGILIIVLLGACNFPRQDQLIASVTIMPENVPALETLEPMQDYASTDCGFTWANEPLPEISSEFNQALQEVLPEAEGFAQAYGENCVTNEGKVVRFLAMETDFYITLQVENLEDRQALGESVEPIMEVLADFPSDKTPGPQPGYIGITFESPEDSLRLWVMRTEVESALEEGLRGVELFNTLQSK